MHYRAHFKCKKYNNFSTYRVSLDNKLTLMNEDDCVEGAGRMRRAKRLNSALADVELGGAT